MTYHYPKYKMKEIAARLAQHRIVQVIDLLQSIAKDETGMNPIDMTQIKWEKLCRQRMNQLLLKNISENL